MQQSEGKFSFEILEKVAGGTEQASIVEQKMLVATTNAEARVLERDELGDPKHRKEAKITATP